MPLHLRAALVMLLVITVLVPGAATAQKPVIPANSDRLVVFESFMVTT